MPLLTEILSPDLPQHDLIAAHPDWTRADFNRAVFALSGSLKTAGIQSAALWFDDAALFACAVLAAWHAGARVLLLPNTARENIGWGETADIFLTDNLVHQQAWHLPECLAQAQRQPENGRQPENWSVPSDAEAHLKTSGSSGKAQIVIKTAAQMQAEAQTLAAALPFGRNGEAVIGSVLLGADDEDDAFDASIFATPAAQVAEIAAALDRADINALITQHAAALQGYDRQDDTAGLRARCQACFAELRAFYREAAALGAGVMVSRM